MLQKVSFRNQLRITGIYSLHYCEFSKTFAAQGESHNFWEINYVDKGELYIQADQTKHLLKQGEAIFFKPNQFHASHANHASSVNIYLASFEINHPAMQYFEDKIFKLSPKSQTILTETLRLVSNVFEVPFDHPSTSLVRLRKDYDKMSLQLIRIKLEEFLINLIMEEKNIPIPETKHNFTDSAQHNMVNSLIRHMGENITKTITIEELCAIAGASRTTVSTSFKRVTGYSIVQYFNQLKIQEAKRLIREGNYNLTQIANMLGYHSLHYFSRRFHLVTGMSPAMYAASPMSKVK